MSHALIRQFSVECGYAAASLRERICSSDPLCAETTPEQAFMPLHGAACHNCLFLPEELERSLERSVALRIVLVEAVLNAQRKPIRYLRDHSLLSRHFEDCFFARTAVTASQTRLKGQLEEAHWAGGFRPRQVQDLHNDLIHPAEMMIRGFHCWQQTRWPGRTGRMHYAHTLFNLYVIRCLQFLSMRLWDEGPRSAGGRLAEIQGVLDELWRSSPGDQPVIVRDARWLIPLAQSLITDELAPYFEVAQQVTETLQEADVLEIQKAHVRMLGGHLTSSILVPSSPTDIALLCMAQRTGSDKNHPPRHSRRFQNRPSRVYCKTNHP